MSTVWSIYIHKNKINGKTYVGITKEKNPERRWGKDGGRYKGCSCFKNAIKKYGWNNFDHKIITTCTNIIDAEFLERFYIALFRSNERNFGYNLENGGSLNKEVSKETREKISSSIIEAWKCPEKANKMSKAHFGKHHTQEAKEKIRNAMSGRKVSEETKEKLRQSSSGRKHTQEELEKMRQAHLGKKFKQETIEKMRQSRFKKVICVNTNKIFSSSSEAGEYYNINPHSIRCSINRNGLCHGLKFKYI